MNLESFSRSPTARGLVNINARELPNNKNGPPRLEETQREQPLAATITEKLGSPLALYWEADMPQANFFASPNNQPTQARPEYHAMLRPASQQSEIRRYGPDDWDAQRPEITRLYLDENNTLKSVMRFMREQHRLNATPKQYKDRIEKWGLYKNIRSVEMKEMIMIQQERGNKRTTFRIGNRSVNSEKVKRYMRNHPTPALSANTDRNLDKNINSKAIPSAIICHTPSDTGSPTSHEVPSLHATTNPHPPFSYQGLQDRLDQFGVLDPPSPLEILGVAVRDEDSDSAGIEQIQGDDKLEQPNLPASPGQQTPVRENIASTDLQNPSDALRILTQVADQAESDGSEESRGNNKRIEQYRPTVWWQDPSPSNVDDSIHYKPVEDGMISEELVYLMFSSYKELFHPFFPIVPRETFDPTRLPWLSRVEPYLFSAILTVASRDDKRVYQICYDHMQQQLISMILVGSDPNIEAVEALLILSQWVSHDPQASVGRGEEDKLAWMYIGSAIRLGCFLGIDQTSFKSELHEDPIMFNRKRLVWLACHMCDSQVSVRLGKRLWAPGPIPLSNLTPADYPTLQPLSADGENWALIFQANLELTQIFSNVRDVLYSSEGNDWKDMLEGRYEKYLDDFHTRARHWNDSWGALECSTRLKASLLLAYDYLRLYINSFAYQATISRALSFQRTSQHSLNRSLPLIDASAPDARFIYEAIDAAKSLLSTFNNAVDPERLRYMPSTYYLFIVYSAVFLFKARFTTTMADGERIEIRQMINQTIERLQEASIGANHMGSRYARLLNLLWRTVPKRSDPREIHDMQSIDNSVIVPYDHRQYNLQSNLDPTNFSGVGGMNNVELTRPGTFSWLDLDAACNFATHNGIGRLEDLEDVTIDMDMASLDMNALMDYSLLDGDDSNLIF